MSEASHVKKNKLLKEKRHDAYRDTKKWPEPTVCTECGALFEKGRWSWKTPSGEANRAVCPACRRIADNYPAGIVEIKGPFLEEHREEILSLIRNIEKHEKATHPMERIAMIIDENEHTVVTTTGVHVARRLGDALSHSYRGDLSFRYREDTKTIWVNWER